MSKITVEQHDDGSFSFYDEDGKTRARFRDSAMLATHFAFTLGKETKPQSERACIKNRWLRGLLAWGVK